jgi:hypothetical protein
MEGPIELNPNVSTFIPGFLSSFVDKAPEKQAGETKSTFLMVLQVLNLYIYFIHMTTLRAEHFITFLQSDHQRDTLLPFW